MNGVFITGSNTDVGKTTVGVQIIILVLIVICLLSIVAQRTSWANIAFLDWQLMPAKLILLLLHRAKVHRAGIADAERTGQILEALTLTLLRPPLSLRVEQDAMHIIRVVGFKVRLVVYQSLVLHAARVLVMFCIRRYLPCPLRQGTSINNCLP